MHVSSFAPTNHLVLEDGMANASGLPITQISVPNQFPVEITIPVLLCVWSEAAKDPNPCIYVQARGRDGQLRGNVEVSWVWDEVDGHPWKWRVFDLMVPVFVQEPGYFMFGIYKRPDDAETEHWFPLAVRLIEEPGREPGRHRAE
jgi:hypothetical protein